MRTPLCDLLGIRYPILQGGLQALSDARLAAAVSAAGGLGLIAARMYSPAGLRAQIRLARSATQAPVGVNLALGARRDVEMLPWVEVICDECVPVVETSGRSPEEYLPRLKAAGVKVIHKVPAVRFAQKAEALGCDAVALVGAECGGHPGADGIGTMVLIRQAVQSLRIPVIAGGGIADGAGLVAALALGAQGVVMGTRFVLTDECMAHPHVKAAMLGAETTDAVLVARSLGVPRRVLRSQWSEQFLQAEAAGAGPTDLLPLLAGERARMARQEGDLSAGPVDAGQAIGLIRSVVPVATLMATIVSEAGQTLARLQGAVS